MNYLLIVLCSLLRYGMFGCWHLLLRYLLMGHMYSLLEHYQNYLNDVGMIYQYLRILLTLTRYLLYLGSLPGN